jgi:ribosomal protein S18 acetylase RimI-like enzyme
LKIIKREITQYELEVVKSGFEEHSLNHGVGLSEQKRLTVVAEKNDMFLGCASGLIDYNWFYITDLWLHHNFRKQGVGRLLIERLEQLVSLDNIDKIYTWTAGHEAPDFYKHMKYKLFAEFENYYPNGKSRFGFRKNL